MKIDKEEYNKGKPITVKNIQKLPKDFVGSALISEDGSLVLIFPMTNDIAKKWIDKI